MAESHLIMSANKDQMLSAVAINRTPLIQNTNLCAEIGNTHSLARFQYFTPLVHKNVTENFPHVSNGNFLLLKRKPRASTLIVIKSTNLGAKHSGGKGNCKWMLINREVINKWKLYGFFFSNHKVSWEKIKQERWWFEIKTNRILETFFFFQRHF